MHYYTYIYNVRTTLEAHNRGFDVFDPIFQVDPVVLEGVRKALELELPAHTKTLKKHLTPKFLDDLTSQNAYP